MEQNELLSSLITLVIAAIVRYFEKRKLEKEFNKNDE